MIKVCIYGEAGHTFYVFQGMPLVKDVSITGVMGINSYSKKSLIDQSAKYGSAPKLYDDFVEMLETEKPDIVSIDGPYETHAPMTIEAVKRGISVYCEKPVATELDQLEELKQALSDNPGVHVFGMMDTRYDGHFYTAYKAIQDGAIGQVRLVHAQKSYKLGTRPDHFKNRKTSAGTIPWVGSHAIDWVYWLSGEEFTKVYANHSQMYNQDNGDLEMSALCHFNMTNEVFASVSIDYLRPSSAETHGDDRIRVSGTKGFVEVRDRKVYLNTVDTDGFTELDQVKDEGQSFASLIDLVRDGKETILSTKDTLDVTEACLLARESADSKMEMTFK